MTERGYLSEWEQLVLLAVLHAGTDACGARIRRDLEETAGRRRSLATIYVVLTRLERRGMVRSWLADPTPVRGGRAKRFFALEPTGIAALREARRTLEAMWARVDAALGPDPG